GDVVRIGSPWRHRMLIVPDLHVALSAGAKQTRIVAPPGARLDVTITSAERGTRAVRSSSSGAGRTVVTWPWDASRVGDEVSAELVGVTGDTLRAVNRLRTIILHVGKPTLTVHEPPDAPLRVQLSSASGRLLATG